MCSDFVLTVSVTRAISDFACSIKVFALLLNAYYVIRLLSMIDLYRKVFDKLKIKTNLNDISYTTESKQIYKS